MQQSSAEDRVGGQGRRRRAGRAGQQDHQCSRAVQRRAGQEGEGRAAGSSVQQSSAEDRVGGQSWEGRAGQEGMFPGPVRQL